MKRLSLFNKFHAKTPSLYPLKSQRFSDVWRELEIEDSRGMG